MTRWFFDHPRLFTGDEAKTFAAADISSDVLTNLPTATEMAQAVVAEMDLQSFLVDGPVVKLLADRTPRFHGLLSYSVNTDTATHQVNINPLTGSGEVRTTHVDSGKVSPQRKRNPLAAISNIQLPDDALTSVQFEVPKILDELRLPSGKASAGRRSASLVFAAEADDVPCIVTYSIANGGITSICEDDRPTMGTADLVAAITAEASLPQSRKQASIKQAGTDSFNLAVASSLNCPLKSYRIGTCTNSP